MDICGRDLSRLNDDEGVGTTAFGFPMNNEQDIGEHHFFWRRLLAFWGDVLLIYLLTYVAVKAAALSNIYLPFELTFLLLAVVYLSGSLYAWGTTGAKVVYGLEVNASASETPAGPAAARPAFPGLPDFDGGLGLPGCRIPQPA